MLRRDRESSKREGGENRDIGISSAWVKKKRKSLSAETRLSWALHYERAAATKARYEQP